MSDSPGLMDFAIGLVDSVINLPNGQMKCFEEFELQKNSEINLLIKTFLGLVKMTFGLVNVNFIQLAQMASSKNDSLCTLIPVTVYLFILVFVVRKIECTCLYSSNLKFRVPN